MQTAVSRPIQVHAGVITSLQVMPKNMGWNPAHKKTSQELRMLSPVTLNCQETMIVMNSSSQLSEL